MFSSTICLRFIAITLPSDDSGAASVSASIDRVNSSTPTLTLPECYPYNPEFVYTINGTEQTTATFAENNNTNDITPTASSSAVAQSHTLSHDNSSFDFSFNVISQGCNAEAVISFLDKDQQPTIGVSDATLVFGASNTAQARTIPACYPLVVDHVLRFGSPLAADPGTSTLSIVSETEAQNSSHTDTTTFDITNSHGLALEISLPITREGCLRRINLQLMTSDSIDRRYISILQEYNSGFSSSNNYTLNACENYFPRYRYYEKDVYDSTISFSENLAPELYGDDPVDMLVATVHREVRRATNQYGLVSDYHFTITTRTFSTSICPESVSIKFYDTTEQTNQIASLTISNTNIPNTAATAPTITMPTCISSQYRFTKYILGGAWYSSTGTEQTGSLPDFTDEGTHLQTYTVTHPSLGSREINFYVVIPACTPELSVSFADTDGNTLTTPATTIIGTTDNPTIAFPACTGYTPSFTYLESDEIQASTSYTLSDNTSGITANAYTAGSYAQSYTVTNDYDVIYTFPFTVTFQTCANVTALVQLSTDDDFAITYATPTLSIQTLADNPTLSTLTLPPCAPYNLNLARYEDSTLVTTHTTSSNLATTPVATNTPGTYTEIRDLTNNNLFSNRFSFNVVVQECNQDLQVTLTDVNDNTIATEIIAIPASNPVANITLLTCAPYNASVTYRHNGAAAVDTVVPSSPVTEGTNTLDPVNANAPNTYAQSYTIQTPYRSNVTANFNVIVSDCTPTLNISFNNASDTSLTNTTINSSFSINIALPACAPYFPTFSYLENNVTIPDATIGANTATDTIPTSSPQASATQTHAATNSYGIVTSFSFIVSPTFCNNTLELSHSDLTDSTITTLADTIVSPTFTLPTCAAYIPSFRYLENDTVQTDATISSANLSSPDINADAAATYTESRSTTNANGFVSSFAFNVLVNNCLRFIAIILPSDDSGAASVSASIDRVNSSTPTLTLPECYPYNPEFVYTINGTEQTTATFAENNNTNDITPTASSSAVAQSHTLSHDNSSFDFSFNVISQGCNAEAVISFLDKDQQPTIGVSDATLVFGASNTAQARTIPACYPLVVDHVLRFGSPLAADPGTSTLSIVSETEAQNSSHTDTTTFDITNSHGLALEISLPITREGCLRQLNFDLLTSDDIYRRHLSGLAEYNSGFSSSNNYTLNACENYFPSFRYYEKDVYDSTISFSENLAPELYGDDPVDILVATTYHEVRRATNQYGLVSDYHFTIYHTHL